MTRYCTKCGTQAANDQVTQCASCGTPLPAPAGATSSTPWVKIIVGVVGCFTLLGLLSAGTCFYIGYRAKQKYEQAKTELGLDKIIAQLPSSSSGENAGGQQQSGRDVCSLLSKEEVSEITGFEVTEVHGDTSKCTYSSATNPTLAETTVTWQGGATAYKIAVGSMRITAPQGKGYSPIPGIGDEACCLLGLSGKDREGFEKEAQNDPTGMLKGITNLLGQFPLMFRKGDVSAMVGVSEAKGDIEEAKKALAIKMASRL